MSLLASSGELFCSPRVLFRFLPHEGHVSPVTADLVSALGYKMFATISIAAMAAPLLNAAYFSCIPETKGHYQRKADIERQQRACESRPRVRCPPMAMTSTIPAQH